MDREGVARWLERYVEAWETYDPQLIGDLFSDDAEYRYHPYDQPVRGRQAIVAGWLEEPDAPGSFEARYRPVAVDGQVAVATGTTTYRGPDGKVERMYDNVFVMRFAPDGRCREFTEWFVKRPAEGG